VLFAFNLYDINNGGSLEVEEIVNMVKEVYGNMWENNAHAKM
jgi:Ca2+-binding EF-hand superfamily protein